MHSENYAMPNLAQRSHCLLNAPCLPRSSILAVLSSSSQINQEEAHTFLPEAHQKQTIELCEVKVTQENCNSYNIYIYLFNYFNLNNTNFLGVHVVCMHTVTHLSSTHLCQKITNILLMTECCLSPLET